MPSMFHGGVTSRCLNLYYINKTVLVLMSKLQYAKLRSTLHVHEMKNSQLKHNCDKKVRALMISRDSQVV